MRLPVKTNVVWTDEKLKYLPKGGSYSTVAKILDDTELWPKEGWSIVLEFEPESAKNRRFEAKARFLMSNAPWERLKSGCILELYEGSKKTATVTVI